MTQRRLFANPGTQRRFRRTSDVLLLAAAGLGLAWIVATYPPTRFQQSLHALVQAVPTWLDPLWGLLYDGFAVWAVALVAATLAARRWTIVLDVMVAVGATVMLSIVSTRLALGVWPDVDSLLRLRVDEDTFPIVRVALCTAAALAVSTHLIRPLQRVSRWVVGFGAAAAALLQTPAPGSAAGAFLVAVVATAAVRLALGTSVGRPETTQVRLALAELGIDMDVLTAAERQPAGAFVAWGSDREGARLLVKVVGRDAYDAQLLEKLRRTVLYQDGGVRVRLSRAETVEHEALFTLLAAQAGVLTRSVVAVGVSTVGDAVLVLRDDVESLTEIPAGPTGDELLAEAWGALLALGGRRIAHHRLGPSTLVSRDGHAGLADFSRATVAATDDPLLIDRAQLLAVTATLAGQERAIESAQKALGRDGLARLLPYLQPAAFSPELRRALDLVDLETDDLRKATASAVGVEEPEPIKLRRLTWGSVVQIGLAMLALAAIAGGLGGLDYEQLASEVENASWGWLAVGLVLAQLPRLTQAVSTLGSVPTALPFVPVYAMQLATSYLNLALPSTFARMTINIRFFQRHGIPPATAVTSGAIDSFAGTVTQALLLSALLLFTGSSLELALDTPSGPPLRALVLILVVGAVALVALLAVRRVRVAVLERLRRWWPDVVATVRGLRAGNKLALLLGGSIATELLFAVALGVFANAFGFDVSLAQLLVINISVSLLASLVPVPGGIGVSEFGLTVGLAAAGMPEEAAFATAILYRVATFYLPPIWGFFAMRWLQRNAHL